MKIDNYYNIEPVIDLYHFVELLLVTLANDQADDSNVEGIKIAKLYPDFKEKIERAMFDENGYQLDYLQLIDGYQYYENQAKWEMSLAKNLQEYLKQNHKALEYNFEYDHIEIEFTVSEISRILENYDQKTQEIMKNFIAYIEHHELSRFDQLLTKKSDRDIKREYIKVSKTTFNNTWGNDIVEKKITQSL